MRARHDDADRSGIRAADGWAIASLALLGLALASHSLLPRSPNIRKRRGNSAPVTPTPMPPTKDSAATARRHFRKYQREAGKMCCFASTRTYQATASWRWRPA